MKTQKFVLLFKEKPIRVYTITESLQQAYDKMGEYIASEAMHMWLDGYCQRSKYYQFDNYDGRKHHKLPVVVI